jgi:hypothetical protein
VRRYARQVVRVHSDQQVVSIRGRVGILHVALLDEARAKRSPSQSRQTSATDIQRDA